MYIPNAWTACSWDNSLKQVRRALGLCFWCDTESTDVLMSLSESLASGGLPSPGFWDCLTTEVCKWPERESGETSLNNRKMLGSETVQTSSKLRAHFSNTFHSVPFIISLSLHFWCTALPVSVAVHKKQCSFKILGNLGLAPASPGLFPSGSISQLSQNLVGLDLYLVTHWDMSPVKLYPSKITILSMAVQPHKWKVADEPRMQMIRKGSCRQHITGWGKVLVAPECLLCTKVVFQLIFFFFFWEQHIDGVSVARTCLLLVLLLWPSFR